MNLLYSWEPLVVSQCNNLNTFDGVRGSLLNEDIRRKASGEGSAVEHLSPLHVLSHNCKTLDYLALMISLRPSFC